MEVRKESFVYNTGSLRGTEGPVMGDGVVSKDWDVFGHDGEHQLPLEDKGSHMR